MKRWILTCFATLSLLMMVASPAAAAPGGNSTNAKDCQKGGWETLARTGDADTAFVNQDECVSYGAQGGTIVSYVAPIPTVTLEWIGSYYDDACLAVVSIARFAPGSYDWFILGVDPESRNQIRASLGPSADGWMSLQYGGSAYPKGGTWIAEVGGVRSAPSTSAC